MNIGLVIFVGEGKRNPVPGKYVWVESALHGETCAKQAESFQPQGFGRVASGFDNAEHWNRGPATDVLENNMRRVSCQQSESRACAGQPLHFSNQIVGQLG